MSMDSTRLRRFARTFSSWPEYACTTYQRASLAETALLTTMFILPRRLRRHSWGCCRRWCGDQWGGSWSRDRGLLRDRLFDAEAQQVVRRADDHCEKDDSRDHDARHPQQLVSSRPYHLLELFPDAAQIAERPAPSRRGDGENRPGWPWATRGTSSLGH